MKNKQKTRNDALVMTVNTSSNIERTVNEIGAKIIRGYAVVFNDTYKYKDFYTGEEWEERVDKNAFKDVNLDNVLHLRDHDYSKVLGRAGKNMRIEIDEIGLFFETVLPDTELARETYMLAEAEICDQCSFGFTIKESKRDLGNKVDIITKIDELFEITITPVPAYKSTVVTTMSEERQQYIKTNTEKREQEKAISEAETLRLKLELEVQRTAEFKNKIEELLK